MPVGSAVVTDSVVKAVTPDRAISFAVRETQLVAVKNETVPNTINMNNAPEIARNILECRIILTSQFSFSV